MIKEIIQILIIQIIDNVISIQNTSFETIIVLKIDNNIKEIFKLISNCQNLIILWGLYLKTKII